MFSQWLLWAGGRQKANKTSSLNIQTGRWKCKLNFCYLQISEKDLMSNLIYSELADKDMLNNQPHAMKEGAAENTNIPCVLKPPPTPRKGPEREMNNR